ncbi:MAG: ATP-binding protein [Candidatus Thermoplasmatota archaeon]
MHTIYIPRINDEKSDFIILFNIWSRCQTLQNFALNFSKCDFLRQNAVAFLGGIISNIKSNGGSVSLNTHTLSSALRANLEQNGFLAAMGVDAPPWDGNSIPYREDQSPDYHKISRYLQEKWLGKGWIFIDPELAKAIVSNVLEIYSNVFTHAQSANGVFSCGQNYPTLEEIKITVVDFGIGIPQSIRDYLYNIGQDPKIPDDKTLQLAFQEGFSTKPDLGGMGLKLLKEFIQLNQGRLDIYSHSGHAIIDASGEHYEIINSFFRGTIVNISINRDQKVYILKH